MIRGTLLDGEDEAQYRLRRQRERVAEYRAKNKERVTEQRKAIYWKDKTPKQPKHADDVILEGETLVEWRKRKSRNKMRRRAAEKIAVTGPTPKKVAYNKGRKLGARNLKTKHSEDMRRDGESETDWLARKARQGTARYRDANKDAVDVRRRELYAQNGQSQANIIWREKNKERMKTWYREYDLKNKEIKIASLKQWIKNNPERAKAATRAWQKANPERWKTTVNVGLARIRAATIQRTPPWADWKEIQKIYAEAVSITKKTGIVHWVDHIVPLNGRTVSGLHVHYNLEVITKTANMLKGNRFETDAAWRVDDPLPTSGISEMD